MSLVQEIMTIFSVTCALVFAFNVVWNRTRDTSAGLHSVFNEAEPLSFLNQLPFSIWIKDDAGRVTYANDACVKWSGLFPNVDDVNRENTDEVTRLSVSNPETGTVAWFDVTPIKIGQSNGYFAENVMGIVEAKSAERDFVQSLSKTFAHLSTAIAVFGRDRNLEYFNPALIDLTALSIDVVRRRPTLFSFFEHLRHNRIMPEQKQFATWRQKVEASLEDIEAGSYQELWTLPDGSVYRVSGRSHSEQAVVLFFEDVSPEIILSRRLKANMELYHTVFDGLDSAVLIFSQDGKSLFENALYLKLWANDKTDIIQNSLSEEMDIWRRPTGCADLNSSFAEKLMAQTGASNWSLDLRLPNDTQYTLGIKRLNGGLIMIRWTPLQNALPDFKLLKNKSVA